MYMNYNITVGTCSEKIGSVDQGTAQKSGKEQTNIFEIIQVSPSKINQETYATMSILYIDYKIPS